MMLNFDNYRNLGFMQGRLSPIIENMIQRFPIDTWKEELVIANKNNWKTLEWTIDYFTFKDNPILKHDFSKTNFNQIKVKSITADFFMQNPFFLIDDKNAYKKLITDFKRVIYAMIKLEIKYIVLPLVDNASLIKNNIEEQTVTDKLLGIFDEFKDFDVEFIFESDFEPKRLLKFIEDFKSEKVGINYDSGNSASLGLDCETEILTYNKWIKNCHLKDRILGGTTVEFGTGNTDFKSVLNNFKKINYSGDFIIQGARSKIGKDLEIINIYRDYIYNILDNEL